jgi:hypothetical protein
MSRASTPTLLSLDRAASILNLNPPHFNSGISAIIFSNVDCGDLTFQWAYQNFDAASREEFATEISNCEWGIANYLCWPVAPTWISQDVAMFPRPHRPDTYDVGGGNVRWQNKSIKSRFGKIIEPGQRATTFIDEPRIVLTDDDGDGFAETATVTCATTLTDECEVKVYFTGYSAVPEWEIRPARTKAIVAGVFTATFWSWQLIDPDLWEAFPTATVPTPTVDLDDAVYVATVDVYREYNDPTAVSAVFFWEPDPGSVIGGCECCGGTGCTHCQLTTQDGCAHIRDAELGVLAPAPGTYADGAWGSDEWAVCRDPDQIKLYYYCGDLSWLNLGGRRCDGLSDQWARIIARMAVARLHRPICACGSAGALIDYLQVDLAAPTREQSYNMNFNDLDNPFGTRRGELEAWHYVTRLVRNSQAGAGAV